MLSTVFHLSCHTYGLIIVFPSLYVFCSLVQSESGFANMVNGAPCQGELQQYEVQFGRLRNFLTGKYAALGNLFYQGKE